MCWSEASGICGRRKSDADGEILMRFQNDNFLGCCGTNTTLNIGEETYCPDCDTYAQVVGEEVTWDNGTATRFDYLGMLTEDAVTV